MEFDKKNIFLLIFSGEVRLITDDKKNALEQKKQLDKFYKPYSFCEILTIEEFGKSRYKDGCSDGADELWNSIE